METTYFPPGLKYGRRMCAAITRRGRATGDTVEVSLPRVVPAWLKSMVSAIGVARTTGDIDVGARTRQYATPARAKPQKRAAAIPAHRQSGDLFVAGRTPG